jgi:MFS family permease
MSQVTTDGPTELKKSSKVALWAALIVAWLGWMFDGMEMGLYTWAIPPALKELLQTESNRDIGPYIGVTVALFLAGMSVGGVVFGRLGDRIGRVRTMIITVAVYAVFTGLSGLSQNFGQLAACRFLGAMGLGGEWGLGVALVMETWPNTSRPLLAGLLGSAANVGLLIAAGATRLLAQHNLSWRWALVMGFLPAVLTLAIRLVVKESDRWVESQKRGERASFADLFSPALRRNSLFGIALSAVAVLGMWGVYQAWMQAWVQQLVEESGSGITAGTARASVSLWMAIGSIIGSLLAGPLAEWMGRRRSYALFCVGSVATSWLLYLTCDAFDLKLLILAGIGGIFAAAFFGWLPLYLPELFPTRIRATGEGLTFNAGRIISAVGAMVTGTLVEALGGYRGAGSLMACIWLVGLVLIWFAPETKGSELPE